MYCIDQEILQERYDLCMERIALLEQETAAPAPFDVYFRSIASFLRLMDHVRKELISGKTAEYSLEEWQALNHAMYEDILPENYETSYANPAYAVRMLGEEHGRALCFLYAQLRGLIGYHFEDFFEAAVIHLEVFLEVLTRYEQAPLPPYREIQQILYWFVSDNCDVLITERIRRSVDPARDFAVRIIMDSDLNDLRYLYRFGEYVTENELKLASYLNSLDEDEIGQIARTYSEGYRVGFVRAGKDLGKKMIVDIRYHLGFERIIKTAIGHFREMGLRPVMFRYALSTVNKRSALRIGFTGANANQQYDYDHREDAALYLDRKTMQRSLGVMRKAYDTFQTLANGYAGPAIIETFGETPFVPVSKKEAYALSEKQQQILVEMRNEAAQLTNRYIIGEERSFTIIAFPVPEIGPQFEEIFRDTVRINTLDADLYERIQQTMIDALDQGTKVHILGRGENRTDLTVQLAPLKDPSRESCFENVVADVNIPVGEVFTTPQLQGTSGLLHVTQVYLQGLDFENLSMSFTDGMITDYGCTNFDTEEEGKAYIRENVLYHHDTLPMGEFAIGTNTAAYVMARRYRIGALMPILIAEKTGPHFAVGDTCYCWSEDMPAYNPDGKECTARDNSISILRKTDPGKAYFGCHTDITIPYAELGLIEVIGKDGQAVELIRDGRFVLPGTEELNKALDEEG